MFSNNKNKFSSNQTRETWIKEIERWKKKKDLDTLKYLNRYCSIEMIIITKAKLSKYKVIEKISAASWKNMLRSRK